MVRWVLTLSPTAFRFARSRWSCEAAAVVLRKDFRVRVGRETVRLWLRSAGLVWPRPRSTILPKYSPDTNPIERVWWRLHEAVTRNHRCQTMQELLDLTFDWFETRTHFRVRSGV